MAIFKSSLFSNIRKFFFDPPSKAPVAPQPTQPTLTPNQPLNPQRRTLRTFITNEEQKKTQQVRPTQYNTFLQTQLMYMQNQIFKHQSMNQALQANLKRMRDNRTFYF